MNKNFLFLEKGKVSFKFFRKYTKNFREGKNLLKNEEKFAKNHFFI